MVENHFNEKLKLLKERLLRIASQVEEAIARSIKALVDAVCATCLASKGNEGK